MVLMAPGGKIPKDRSWKAARATMARVDAFLDSLIKFDKENIHENCLKALQPYLEDPKFKPEFVTTKSYAAAGLCSWVVNIVRFHEAYCDVEPKRQALSRANAELAAAQDKLASIKAKIAVSVEGRSKPWHGLACEGTHRASHCFREKSSALGKAASPPSCIFKRVDLRVEQAVGLLSPFHCCFLHFIPRLHSCVCLSRMASYQFLLYLTFKMRFASTQRVLGKLVNSEQGEVCPAVQGQGAGLAAEPGDALQDEGSSSRVC